MSALWLLVCAVLSLVGVEANPGPMKNVSGNDDIVIATMNARSAVNKAADIHSMIHAEQIDILALSETFVKPGMTDSILNGVAPSGYKVIHAPRSDGRKGGGVVFIFRLCFGAAPVNITQTPTSFEYLAVCLTVNKAHTTFLNIYRPPQSNVDVFYSELSDLLDVLPYVRTYVCMYVLCGFIYLLLRYY